MAVSDRYILLPLIEEDTKVDYQILIPDFLEMFSSSEDYKCPTTEHKANHNKAYMQSESPQSQDNSITQRPGTQINEKIKWLKKLNEESMPLIKETIELVRQQKGDPSPVNLSNLSNALEIAGELLAKVASEYTTTSEALAMIAEIDLKSREKHSNKREAEILNKIGKQMSLKSQNRKKRIPLKKKKVIEIGLELNIFNITRTRLPFTILGAG